MRFRQASRRLMMRMTMRGFASNNLARPLPRFTPVPTLGFACGRHPAARRLEQRRSTITRLACNQTGEEPLFAGFGAG
jgi:hypothetical protein